MSNLPVPASPDALAPVDLDALDAATLIRIDDADERLAELGRRVAARYPLAVTDADGAMADLGVRVQEQYPGAITTAAGVRAVRESWVRPSLWRRIVVWVTVR